MPNSESVTLRAKPRISGLGRVLITIYVILALAATLRAAYQIISKFDEAPLAYILSLVSGLVYILATVALIRRDGVWRSIGWIALIFEFTGVVVVGTLSLTLPEMFAHPSVWSMFGIGYGFVPLVLPVFGMVWLRRDSAVSRRAASQSAGEDHHAREGS